jgi:hypothetical protein
MRLAKPSSARSTILSSGMKQYPIGGSPLSIETFVYSVQWYIGELD